MKITWLAEADRTFNSQIAYLGERNPAAAIDMGDAIMSAIARLADAPQSARPGRIVGTRELVVTGTPFIVVYRIEADTVLILRVLHGAQRWPPAS